MIAFLFPGQGSQRVGMGAQLCEAYPRLRREYFERADDLLGFPLSRLCFEGPEDELVKTENQQPAIFLVSAATNAALRAPHPTPPHPEGTRYPVPGTRHAGTEPAGAAGHSLGEYSALHAAGSISFEEGLRLTRRRGEQMAEVAARTGGIMAAVLGLAVEDVEAACREASAEGVAEVANYNSPTQTVISGEEAPVRRAMELCKERGAQRVIQLNVSAPFHCSLMTPLAAAFGPELDAASIQDPDVPVVANVSADYERSAAEIRRNLVTQLSSSVRWSESIRRLIADGFDTFVEVGPGKVLTGLMRAIDPSVTAYHTADISALEKAVESTRES